jgi:hypothetical protein
VPHLTGIFVVENLEPLINWSIKLSMRIQNVDGHNFTAYNLLIQSLNEECKNCVVY